MPDITNHVSRNFTTLLLTAAFFTFAAGIALRAQPVLALSAHPALYDVEIEPGQTETRTVTIVNDTRSAETYLLTIQKFIPQGELGQQRFLDPSDTAGLPEWMFVDRPQVTLAPGQALPLPVTIRVPENAQAGGYYAALFLSRSPSVGEELAMLPRVGLLFFVRVKGPAVERLTLEDFGPDADGPYERLPVGFRVSLLNQGNVHLVPEGTITVKNMFGATVARLPVNPGSGRILPDSRRVYTAAWAKGESSEGSGYWHGLLQELSHFAVGRYRAKLELSGPGFATPVLSEVEFSVWPWRTGVALGGLSAALLLLFFVFKRLAIRSATAKSDPLK